MKTPFLNKAKKLLEKSKSKFIYYDPFLAQWTLEESDLYIKIPREEFLQADIDDIEELLNKHKKQFSNITENLKSKYQQLLELTSSSSIVPKETYFERPHKRLLSQEDENDEVEEEYYEELLSRYELPRRKHKFIEYEEEIDEDEFEKEFEDEIEVEEPEIKKPTRPFKYIGPTSKSHYKRPTSKISIISQDEITEISESKCKCEQEKSITEQDELLTAEKKKRPPKKWFERCKEKAKKFADDPAAFCAGLWYHPERYPGGEKMKKSFGESLEFLKEQITVEFTPEELVELNKKYPGIGMEIFRKSKTYADLREEFGEITDYVIKVFALNVDEARKFKELFPDEKIFADVLKVFAKHNVKFPDYNLFATFAEKGIISETLPKALELIAEKEPENLKKFSATEQKTKTQIKKLLNEIKKVAKNE